jgi:hypothetical protein
VAPGSQFTLTTNELECGQPGCHLDLDIDRTRFDVFERNRGDPLNHSCPCFAHELTAQLLLRQEQLENNVATHGDEVPEHRSFAGGAEVGTRGRRVERSYRQSLASMRSQIMAATSGPPKFFTARMPVGEVTLISVR